MEVLFLLFVVHIPWADIATICTALAVLGNAWLTRKAKVKIEENADELHTQTDQLSTIHLLVNSRLTEALNKVKELERLLKKEKEGK